MAELQVDFLAIPIPDFLCGVGVFSVALCYLLGSLCFPLFWDQRDISEVSKPELLKDSWLSPFFFFSI